MQPSGEPVPGCVEVSSEVLTSNETMASEGLDPSPSEPQHGDVDAAAGAPASHQVFSMEAEPSTHTSPPGNPLPSSGPVSQASEGVLHATGHTGPARAVLQCFAGPAQLASASVKQGYFSYGVDRVKHKSAMAPVLQMDLSSRSACDSILMWLDKQKVAGVMICVPKHSLEPTTLAFVYAVVAGCMEHDLPLVLEGASTSQFWKGLERLQTEQLPPHRVEVEWRCWSGAHSGRALVMSNLPEIVVLRREVPEPATRAAAVGASTAGYPAAFANALAEIFVAGITARRLPCLNPARINKAARVAAMKQPRGAMSEVVPEWKLVVYVLLPRSFGADPFAGAKRLKQAWSVPEDVRVSPGLKTLPADSQLLSRTQSGGNLSPQLQQEMQQLNGSWVLRVGIPWDPIEFIGQAGKLGHPFHQLSKSNKFLEELIEQLVYRPSVVRSKRNTPSRLRDSILFPKLFSARMWCAMLHILSCLILLCAAFDFPGKACQVLLALRTNHFRHAKFGCVQLMCCSFSRGVFHGPPPRRSSRACASATTHRSVVCRELAGSGLAK